MPARTAELVSLELGERIHHLHKLPVPEAPRATRAHAGLGLDDGDGQDVLTHVPKLPISLHPQDSSRRV